MPSSFINIYAGNTKVFLGSKTKYLLYKFKPNKDNCDLLRGPIKLSVLTI